MSVERSFEPDLQSDAICDFLKNTGAEGDTYTYDDEVRASWEGQGYAYSRRLWIDHLNIDPANDPLIFNRQTYWKRTCRVYTRPPAERLLETVQIIEPVDHKCEMLIHALLFIKVTNPPMPQATVDLIENAFDINNLNDVDAVETQLHRDGVDADAYQVVFSFDFVRRAAPNALGHNEAAFREAIQNNLGVDGQPLYSARWDDAAVLSCSEPSNEHNSDHVILANPDDPSEAILAEATEKYGGGEGSPCPQIVVIDRRIGTAYQYYEWQTRWEPKNVRIGRCRIVRMRVPVIYSRIARQAVWAFVFTAPDIAGAAEKGLKDCIIVSAAATAVLVIVSGGMGIEAAAAAFKAACQACIEAKINDARRCLFTDLKLVLEHTDWEEKVF